MSDDNPQPRNMKAALAQLAGSQRALRTVMGELRNARAIGLWLFVAGFGLGVLLAVALIWRASRMGWER